MAKLKMQDEGLGIRLSLLGAIHLCCLILSPALSVSMELPEVHVSVSFDMQQGLMHGISRVVFHEDWEGLIHYGSLRIRSLRLDGKPVGHASEGGDIKVRTKKGSVFEVQYECSSEGGSGDACIISNEGVFLTGRWYPSVEGLAYYRVEALVPPEFTAVSEAEDIKVDKDINGNRFFFKFPHPLDGINLIAGRFNVKKEDFRGIELYTYFFPEDAYLADTYLEYTKRYLELYEGITGKFPYKRFSVVENFLPTGYSMPTFTLLGRDVVRLPFIVRTSLGHEILHQWLGNLVFVDYGRGNWAEGLTTYLSDHLYEEREGRGWQYRKQMLIDYESYVSPDKDFPLRDFKGRVDPASRAIGYGKSAMVFHMLRRFLGDEVFYGSLRRLIDERRFQRVSWDDIRDIFAVASGRELGWFFVQWLNEKGFPVIEIKNIKVRPKGLQNVVAFDIEQKGRPYTLDMPVSVQTDRGRIRQVLRISDKRQGFEILTDGNPLRLIFDEDYDIFRGLSIDETPPVIARLLGDDRRLLVLPSGDAGVYSGLIEYLKREGYEVSGVPKKSSTFWGNSSGQGGVRDEDIKRSSLLILGYKNPLIKRLFGRIDETLIQHEAGFVLMAKKNPMNPSKVVVIAHSDSMDETEASLRKISHYGKYSMIAFKGGKNIAKRIDDSQRGWGMSVRGAVIGFEPAKAVKLDEIIERVSDKKIIYIGEQHDRYEQHMVQLEIIKGLFRRNPKIAIGMEMFQRSSQKALDDYIGGRIDERGFLKSSGYFKTWGFDYNLYRDILRFARDEGIPVVALNIRREVVSKVSRNGIDSLTGDEKKELPDSMDMSDEGYKKRLREVFERHEATGGKDFDNFYQSQIIWDEIMAQSIDEYLKKNPECQMVVIAGGGHLSFGSGIPKRTFRRNGFDYAIILNDVSIDNAIADFVLFPGSVEMTQSPRLMAMLKEEGGRIIIEGFPQQSVSEKAGLRRGDIIISMDDSRVNSIEDIKISLLYKRKGDVIKVRVLRKRFLFGEKEMEFDVTL